VALELEVLNRGTASSALAGEAKVSARADVTAMSDERRGERCMGLLGLEEARRGLWLAARYKAQSTPLANRWPPVVPARWASPPVGDLVKMTACRSLRPFWLRTR